MSLPIVGILGLVVLLILISLGMPIALSMGVAGFLGYAYIVSFEGAIHIVVSDFFNTFSHYSFTVLPLFVLMGAFVHESGISARLFDAAYKWFGHFPGGLAMTTIGACTAFGAVTGSGSSAIAGVGQAAIPEMKKYRYDRKLATGTMCAGSGLASLIPPSSAMIVYGLIVQESIGKLFISGILPGLLMAFLYCVTIWIWARFVPQVAPRGPHATWRERVAALSGTIEVAIIFLLVIGCLFAGIFTPTESGAVGAFASFVVCLARRRFTLNAIRESFFSTLRISCMVVLILACAFIFAHFITVTRVPFEFARWVGGLPLNRYASMGVIFIMYNIFGCFMEFLPLTVITVPIFYPVVVTQLGFNPIWFGLWLVLVGNMGTVTPPVGKDVFVTHGIAPDVPLEEIFKGACVFLIPMAIGCALLLFFPQIALVLPSFMRY